VEEFICLKSKLYAHKIFENEKQAKKPKGIKRMSLKNCFEDFRKCLLVKEPIYKKRKMFRTKNHDIYAVEQN
jgi:hypothetical protein